MLIQALALLLGLVACIVLLAIASRIGRIALATERLADDWAEEVPDEEMGELTDEEDEVFNDLVASELQGLSEPKHWQLVLERWKRRVWK